MKTPRLLAPVAIAAVLGLGLSACGSDDDAAPAASSTSASTGGSTQTPRDGDVTDADLRGDLEKVALGEVGSGRVTDVEYSDDRDHAYEVEVDLGNDDDVTVEIGEDLSVVRTDR